MGAQGGGSGPYSLETQPPYKWFCILRWVTIIQMKAGALYAKTRMKDRIFLINILKFYDPIRCNYGEINDKTSKSALFLVTTENSRYRYLQG